MYNNKFYMYRLLIFYFTNPRNFKKIICHVLFQANNVLCVYIIVYYTYTCCQREGKAQFGCEELEGVELENQGGESTALQHWEKRMLGVS